MIIEKFLENFELLTDTQAGIKRLRQIVLKMANKGLIVSQESGDGNAFQELALINKSEVSEPLIQDVVHLSSYPYNWTVASFTNIGKWMGGNGFPTSEQGHKTLDILFCKVSDMNLPINSRFILETTNTIVRQTAKRLRVNILPIGTVIFPKIGGAIATNKRRLICKPTVMDNNCMGLAPSSAIDSEWLFLLLSSIDMTHYQSGTSIPSLSQRVLDQITFGIPPLKEQKRIVQKVNELFSLCDELEVAVDVRDSFARSARKSAVDGISTAQTPKELQGVWELIQKNWEVIAGTTESIESLRELILDVLFKPKKIDEWEIRSFGDLLTISNGDRSKNYPSKEFRVSAGIPFVNAGHLKDGQIDLSEMDYISREKYESLSGGKFQDGDILFCLRGSLGKSALVKNFGEGTIASSLAIIRVGVEIDSEYLFWFLQSGMARLQIKRFDNGTAQPNLAAKSVLKFEIPLPKLSEQKSIVNKVAELMKICDELQQRLIQKEEVADKFARSVVSVSA